MTYPQLGVMSNYIPLDKEIWPYQLGIKYVFSHHLRTSSLDMRIQNR